MAGSSPGMGGEARPAQPSPAPLLAQGAGAQWAVPALLCAQEAPV